MRSRDGSTSTPVVGAEEEALSLNIVEILSNRTISRELSSSNCWRNRLVRINRLTVNLRDSEVIPYSPVASRMLFLHDTYHEFTVCHLNLEFVQVETLFECLGCVSLAEWQILKSGSSLVISDRLQGHFFIVRIKISIDHLSAVSMSCDSDVVGVVSSVIIAVVTVNSNLVEAVRQRNSLVNVKFLRVTTPLFSVLVSMVRPLAKTVAFPSSLE